MIFGVEESALGFSPLEPDAALLPAASSAVEESVLDVAARMQRWGRVNVDPAAVNALFQAGQNVVDRYEHEGPQGLAPEVVRMRRGIDVFMEGRQHPRHLLQTYKAAAKASGLLGYMAVNLSRPELAVVYCDEAFQLASHAGDRELQAWVRGTQSFAAYYRGDYTQARDLARDGLRYAGTRGAAIRLLVNGEARALSRLNDADGVDAAVASAYALLDELSTPTGLTSCISFEPYGHARVAANAATAYLSLGDTARVLEYARPLDQAVEDADSDWSRSLVRLDVATALVRQRSPRGRGGRPNRRPCSRSVGQQAHSIDPEAGGRTAEHPDSVVGNPSRPSFRRGPQHLAGAGVGRVRTPALSASEAPFPDDLPSSLTDPEVIREHDWAAFKALDTMRNHWDRPGWDAGQQYYYWFLTFTDPAVIQLAEEGQKALAELPFDPVPPDGLHLTIAKVGSVEDVTPELASDVAEAAGRACRDLDPLRLAVGPLTGSRGAVRFSVAPWAPLLHIHDRLSDATDRALVRPGRVPSGRFRPHIGVAYCHQSIEASQVVKLLCGSRGLPAINVDILAIELVVLQRQAHEYRWARYQRIPLG